VPSTGKSALVVEAAHAAIYLFDAELLSNKAKLGCLDPIKSFHF
jgi:hypothetical protein